MSCGKMRFLRESDAQVAVYRIFRVYQSRGRVRSNFDFWTKPIERLDVYKCPHCTFWHIGHSWWDSPTFKRMEQELLNVG